jgi:hypothetical protein
VAILSERRKVSGLWVAEVVFRADASAEAVARASAAPTIAAAWLMLFLFILFLEIERPARLSRPAGSDQSAQTLDRA